MPRVLLFTALPAGRVSRLRGNLSRHLFAIESYGFFFSSFRPSARSFSKLVAIDPRLMQGVVILLEFLFSLRSHHLCASPPAWTCRSRSARIRFIGFNKVRFR